MDEWLEPGVMTDPGKYRHLLDDLPADVPALFRVVQGLMLHEFWADEYGVTLPPPPRETVNTRPVERLLEAIVACDDRPLGETREPGGRIATNCRGFTVLAVALLRVKGVPARSRSGFGAYFTDGYYEDHWVVEFFDGARWRLGDAQLDDLQAGRLGVTFDRTDIPRDRFVIPSDAWRLVRDDRADPSRFGLSAIGEAGEWWIAANLMRDAAALTGVETLPWDTWGVMPEPDDAVDRALFEELAAATAGPSMPDVRRLLTDDRLRVPEEVFNVQRGRREPLLVTSAA
jgi:hypothetical protein